MKAYLKYSGLGAQMIGSVLVGVFLGKWMDKTLNLSTQIFTILLSLFFLGGSFYLLIKGLQADEAQRKQNVRKKSQSSSDDSSSSSS